MMNELEDAMTNDWQSWWARQNVLHVLVRMSSCFDEILNFKSRNQRDEKELAIFVWNIVVAMAIWGT